MHISHSSYLLCHFVNKLAKFSGYPIPKDHYLVRIDRIIDFFFFFQVVIVPIWKKTDEKNGVLNATLTVKETLQAAGIRVKVDDSEQRTPGWKYNFWEMKVCLFLQIKSSLKDIYGYCINIIKPMK